MLFVPGVGVSVPVTQNVWVGVTVGVSVRELACVGVCVVDRVGVCRVEVCVELDTVGVWVGVCVSEGVWEFESEIEGVPLDIIMR